MNFKKSTNSSLEKIEVYHNNDVLCGRGRLISGHIGNRCFRQLVKVYKSNYAQSSVSEKTNIAFSVVKVIRSQNPSGRFLEQDPKTGLWTEIGDKRAVEKVRQALREIKPKPRATSRENNNRESQNSTDVNYESKSKSITQNEKRVSQEDYELPTYTASITSTNQCNFKNEASMACSISSNEFMSGCNITERKPTIPSTFSVTSSTMRKTVSPGSFEYASTFTSPSISSEKDSQLNEQLRKKGFKSVEKFSLDITHSKSMEFFSKDNHKMQTLLDPSIQLGKQKDISDEEINQLIYQTFAYPRRSFQEKNPSSLDIKIKSDTSHSSSQVNEDEESNEGGDKIIKQLTFALGKKSHSNEAA